MKVKWLLRILIVVLLFTLSLEVAGPSWVSQLRWINFVAAVTCAAMVLYIFLESRETKNVSPRELLPTYFTQATIALLFGVKMASDDVVVAVVYFALIAAIFVLPIVRILKEPKPEQAPEPLPH
jgi:hypothetical protein